MIEKFIDFIKASNAGIIRHKEGTPIKVRVFVKQRLTKPISYKGIVLEQIKQEDELDDK